MVLCCSCTSLTKTLALERITVEQGILLLRPIGEVCELLIDLLEQQICYLRPIGEVCELLIDLLELSLDC